jgi:hypothetical protein
VLASPFRQKDGWPQMTLVTPGIDAQGRVLMTSRGYDV